MAKMKELQPKLKKLQEKFKKDPSRVQQETMVLYRENNVNPLSGCLPLLVQIPFLISLFMTLQSDAFKNLLADPAVTDGFLWLGSLVGPDKTYILPVLVGLSSYFAQKTMPNQMDQSAQGNMPFNPNVIFKYMPILMVVISVRLAGGVLIYWVVSQFVSAAQQYFIQQKMQVVKTTN
jgi:YidC/Oxa1 family membrane protein insertase